MTSSPPEAHVVAEGSPSSSFGYTLQDVNFGRLYKVATQTSKRVLKAVLLVVLRRARVASVGAWPASIADYCSQVLGWSNTRFRQTFNAEERTLLQQPVDAADIDVSLLSKLMHKMFQDINVPETLWRAMRDLKKLRNLVCHEHLLLDEEELTQKLKDLKAIYAALLCQVSKVFDVKMDELIRTFCAEVDEVMSSSVMMEASEYFEKVKQFRMDLVGQFIMQGQRELMDHYSKLQVLNPFTWLSSKNFPQLQVDKIFTPLLITQNSRSVQAATLLTAETMEPDTEEESGVLPDVLVLSGIAGCGKTSLCLFLLHDWRTHEGAVATLKSVDILLYIEARNVTSSSLVTFLQKTLLAETCSHFEEKDIVQTLRQVSVLYVIDGMDEATSDAKLLVSDVFSLAGGSRVLLTTRPEYTSAVTQLAERHHLSHMELAIHGFSDEGRRAFTSRIFAAYVPDESQRHRQEKEFLKFLKTSCRGFAGYLKLPLTLALLACLWQDDKTRIAQITSTTRLYSEIFRLCTTKMATRLQGSSAPHTLDLQGFVASWLQALGKEAYRMLEEGRLVIEEETQRQLAGLCEAQGVDSLQVFSTFLQCEVHTGLLGVNHNFSFVHKSQMEYLAALYLSKEVMAASKSKDTTVQGTLSRFQIFRNSMKKETMADIRDFILFSGWGAKWVNTWLFVVGHLCLQKAARAELQAVLEAILSVPSVRENVGTMWSLVEESSRHSLVREKVGAAMAKEYSWRPSDEDLCDASHPVAMLMQHTPFTPQSIMVRVVGSLRGTQLLGEDGHLHTAAYDNLTPILTCVSQRPSCLVYLKLDEHYYTWGGQETADHLLKLLQPQGNVVSFTGHLGPAGAAALDSSKQMGELNVRVSKAATLEALAQGVLKQDDRVHTLMLCLDLPWSLLPAALPRLHPFAFHLVLHGVHDGVAAAAAEAMAQLSQTFNRVDFVASRLTHHGAKTCLDVLSARKVALKGRLTVRSTHALQEDARRTLEAEVEGGGGLHWWS
ncbi:NACHT, LRR and PYD domains-containing protein 10 [Chionoecetes opilio]|uniref:NACHT, LRR and PYD domains-containing protein 10 n=1 Tax=Chionoecetes opilio TaxID=41210 RepID=A0A8J5D665_CHIOP|nr:NACHT, LRR and PYD domains-containing protein 10 [Chionoecetes opilio]